MIEGTELEEAIENEITPAAPVEEQAATPAPADSSTPKPVTPDDPEFDLGMDEENKPLKFKRSQILEFKKGTMLQSDYTKKTQELAAQREELKEVLGLVEHLKANPEKAKRIIAILDEKEEAAEQKIDEIEEILKTLPEDDPYAKTLRALRAQNQQLLKLTQDMQGKLGSFEQKTSAVEKETSVKQATEYLTTTLDETVKSFKFDDDDDKADWRKAVLTFLVNNPKKYGTEEDFKNTIRDVGKAEYEAIVKRNERVTARYLKSKGGPAAIPTHPAGGGAKPLSKKPSLGGRGEENNLQETLEEALQGELQNKE